MASKNVSVAKEWLFLSMSKVGTLASKLRAKELRNQKTSGKQKRQPDWLPFFLRLRDRKTGSGEWRCKSKPGRPTPSSRFLPVVLSGPGSPQTQLPDPLRES